jgi:hypothetical protein
MKAIFIDSENQEVREVDYDGDFHFISNIIGCDLFTCVQLNDENDTIYVDDEGLINGTDNFFLIEGYPQPLAGNGLILRTNDMGESEEPFISVDEVAEMVTFMDRRAVIIASRMGAF